MKSLMDKITFTLYRKRQTTSLYKIGLHHPEFMSTIRRHNEFFQETKQKLKKTHANRQECSSDQITDE